MPVIVKGVNYGNASGTAPRARSVSFPLDSPVSSFILGLWRKQFSMLVAFLIQNTKVFGLYLCLIPTVCLIIQALLAFGTTGLQSTKRWIRRAQVQLQTSSWPLSRFCSSPCYEVDLMHKYDTNPEQHILISLSECKLGGHPTPDSFAFVSLLIDIFRVAKLVQVE